jgi:hypothetical protein
LAESLHALGRAHRQALVPALFIGRLLTESQLGQTLYSRTKSNTIPVCA